MGERLEIIVTATDHASGTLGKVGGALGRIGEIAAGILAAGLFERLASGIMSLGQEGLQAIADYERLGATLQTLAARELVNSGAAKDMASALEMAKGQAQELLKWTEQLAIKSPFDQEGVAQAFKTAMAYGFTADEAKRLTQATIDFAAGSGASVDAMNSIELALGQIKAKGKLSGQEILQLVNTGIPVTQILAKAFGKTTAEIMKMTEQGLIPADDAIEAIVSSLETDFGGAAARQANTWAGLMSTLSDIKTIGLREFFGGIAEVLQPVVQQFAEWLQGPGLTKLHEWGIALGNLTARLLQGAQNLKDFSIQSLGEKLKTALGALAAGGLGVAIGSLIGSSLLSGIGAFLQSKAAPFLGKYLMGGMQIVGKMPIFAPLLKMGGLGKLLAPLAGMLAPLVSAAAPLLLIAGAVMAVVGAFQLLQSGGLNEYLSPLGASFDRIKQTFSLMQPFIQQVASTLGGAFLAASQQLAQQVMPFLVAQFDKFSQWFADNRPLIQEFISAIVNFVSNILLPAIVSAWQFIQPILGGLIDLILGIAKVIMQVATGDWSGAWETIKQTAINVGNAIKAAIFGFLNWIAGLMGSSLTQIGATWKANWEAFKLMLSLVWQNIVNALQQRLTQIKTTWNSNWESFKQTLSQIWSSIVSTVQERIARVAGAFDGIVKAIQGAISWVKQLASQLSSLTIPSWLTPGSPTPFELGLVGINKAMSQLAGKTMPSFAIGFDALPSANSFGSMPSVGIATTRNAAIPTGGNGTGGIVINLTYAPMLSTASADELESRLMPFIQRGIRQSRSGVGNG